MQSKTLTLLLTLILLTLFTATCFAEPQVSIKNKYYTVNPATATELKLSLNKASPVKDKFRTFHANTKWEIKWALRWKKSGGQCALTKVDTTLHIRYIYPKLSKHNNNPETAEKFATYLAALTEHEQGHGAFGTQAAHAIETALLNQPPQKRCYALSSKANKLAKNIIKEYRQKGKDYDTQTQHGKTQGALIK